MCHPRFGANFRALEILCREPAHELLDRIVLHEIYRGATETAAGQTRAITTRQALRDFDQRIQLRGAVLKIIPRTSVALPEVLAELINIALAQRAFPLR